MPGIHAENEAWGGGCSESGSSVNKLLITPSAWRPVRERHLLGAAAAKARTPGAPS